MSNVCKRNKMMGDRHFDFVPPWKPVPLLQELYFPDRWAMMVCCIMLNCTSRKQVDNVVEGFFAHTSNAEDYVKTYETEKGRANIIDIIHPLGFCNRRSERIYNLSKSGHRKGLE